MSATACGSIENTVESDHCFRDVSRPSSTSWYLDRLLLSVGLAGRCEAPGLVRRPASRHHRENGNLAVDTVIGFRKQKLPPELSGQLDSLQSGQESSSGILDAVKC